MKTRLFLLLLLTTSLTTNSAHSMEWLNRKLGDWAQFLVPSLLKNNTNPNLQNNFGYTALHIAAKSGDINSVEKLLKLDSIISGIDAQSKFQDTPLHLAAIYGEAEVEKKVSYENYKKVIQNLIYAGANPELKNKDDKTPFEAALDLARTNRKKSKLQITPITQCITSAIENKKQKNKEARREAQHKKETTELKRTQQKKEAATIKANKQKQRVETRKQAALEKNRKEEADRKMIKQRETLALKETKRQEEEALRKIEEEKESEKKEKEHKRNIKEEKRKQTEEEKHKQKEKQKELEEERNRQAKQAAAKREELAQKKQKEAQAKNMREKIRTRKEIAIERNRQEELRKVREAESKRKAELAQHKLDQERICYFMQNLMAYLSGPQQNYVGFDVLSRDVRRLKLQLLDLRDTYGYPIEYGTGEVVITFGRTPLHHAVAAKNLPVIRLFLDNGADPRANLCGQTGAEIKGTSPWAIADTMQSDDSVYGEIATILLEKILENINFKPKWPSDE